MIFVLFAVSARFPYIPMTIRQLTCVRECPIVLEHKYPGVPQIFLQEVEPGKNFFINHTEIIPFQVMHGRLPILGYRIGKRLAYITDMLTMPEESYEQLQDLDVLVVNALRVKPHPTHQSISEALRQQSALVRAKLILFT